MTNNTFSNEIVSIYVILDIFLYRKECFSEKLLENFAK